MSVSNISFELRGQKVDLKYVWPVGADVIHAEVAKNLDLLNPDMVQMMMRIVRPGDFVVDGGAGIGYFTVLLSKLVGPKGRVIAIEPHNESVDVITLNLLENEIENVTVIKRALWSIPNQDKTLYLAELSHGNSLSAENPERTWAVPVKTTTLNLYTPARLVKLDIEGAEYEALSCIQVEPRYVPFIICELNNIALPRMGTTSVAVRQMMHSKGYETYLINADGSPVLLTPHQGVAVNRSDINVLFSTPEAVSTIQ